ncbi:hypothetical protein FE257_001241 [Aspergillus nanangensis]|uniref:Zn(2)-C6 fungal-type domain-containing protein n=1 Tax=Aspergillus nanangensis TaxID=2582783 RepID=A0AAD4CE64_ASPNN|nr:hypothetical protein FE257_001241 [Aspergillus nanangensis]
MATSRSGGQRQRPVACTFCRTRKLRCNRVFPCSSCTSRGLRCQQGFSITSPDNNNDSPSAQNTAILERLARLEDIVLNTTDAAKIKPGDQTRPPAAITNTVEPELDTAIDRLEAQCITGSGVRSPLSEDIFGEAYPLRELVQRQTFVLRPDITQSSDLQPYRCVLLPEKHETASLLEIYFHSTTYMFHVIHIPSVQKIVDGIYKSLCSSNPYDCRHVALLLSILASTAYMWSPRDIPRGLFTTIDEAHKQAVSWTKSALDLIEHSCRTSNTSLELLQASIITSFLIFNLDGLSSKWRCLFSSTITLAREMSLHQIDKPSSRKVSGELSVIEKEVGRRIWWHVTATDWMLAGMSGPQEGIYSIYPAQMNVNKPLHLDDYSLQGGNLAYELPHSEPSTMSYFLNRIRLAELTRESIACTCPDINNASYEEVLRIDGKITKFLEDLPPFFHLDSAGQGESVENLNAGIMVQRYVINFLTNSRRCKLHLAFLRKDNAGELYRPSRTACLEASRQIIRTERLFEDEGSWYATSRMRFSGTLHCLFTACTVLAVDLCNHKMTRQHDERMDELKEACQILKEGRAEFPFVAPFVGSLMNVLRRHRVNLPVGILHDLEKSQTPVSEATSIPNDVTTTPNNTEFPNQDFSVFDEIWQDFRNEIDFDTLDWSEIFTELDSQAL